MKKYITAIALFFSSIAAFGQNVGIGTATPVARLHVADSSVLFSGPQFLPAEPGTIPATGSGSRLMWYPGKAAFRAGYVFNDGWSKDNIGTGSFAGGFNNKASGISSFSFGQNNNATGVFSFAGGNLTNSSNRATFAFGELAEASGYMATAIGNFSIASGYQSFSLGYNTKSTGNNATATGFSSEATAFSSFSAGYFTKAKSDYSFVIGQYNDTTATNRLFEIGKGTANNARLNALTVLQNGNTGIGTINPAARLHVDSSVVFTAGSTFYSAPAAPPVSGPGSRMMWYADKAAFRTGTVDGAQWDRDSIGRWSFAAGEGTKAKGKSSFAGGAYTNAYADHGTALGYFSAAGERATALGYVAIANGFSGTAIGFAPRVDGVYSHTIGNNNFVDGSFSFSFGNKDTVLLDECMSLGYNLKHSNTKSIALGFFNDVSGSNKLFEIGNGSAPNTRSNAVTVLRNGNMGVGTTNPAQALEVVAGPSASATKLVIGNRGGFGPAAMEFVSDYGFGSQWRPGYVQSGDAGNFTGRLEFFTNGSGQGSLYGAVKGLEVRNGAVLTASGSVGSFSDARLKNSMAPFTDGLNVIEQINPITFQYNADAPFTSPHTQVAL